MTRSFGALCLLTATLLIVETLGCGTGKSSTPLTAIGKTSHPLVALYGVSAFHKGLSAWVEFGPDTNYGRQTSVMKAVDTPIEDQLSILVAGMKPQTTYHMRAHVNWSGGSWVDQDHTFTTGAIPASAKPIPQFAVTTPANGIQGAKPGPGVELFSFIPPAASQAVVTDLQGNVIWYCPGTAFPVKPMANGHFLINREIDIQEVDLACNTIRDVSLNAVNAQLQAKYHITIDNLPLGLFHHDVAVLPNGHWIAIGQTTQNFNNLPGYSGTTTVLGDILVDIDPNGNVVWVWSTFEHLDVNRHPLGFPDWTHANAIVYTPDGNLLFSMRDQSWILKIDYENGAGSGNVLWKLGEGGDFTILSGDPSQWFYGQHFPNLLSTNGSQMTLAVFDDGNLRTYSDGEECGTTPTAPYCFSRGVIYNVDESTHLAEVVFQYFPSLYTFWGGSIVQLSNGDVEIDMSEPYLNASSDSLVTEVTGSEAPQVVWQMKVSGANAYRGYRIPSLYPGVTWQN